MDPRTPLALFVYNRPRHTRRALAAIARLQRLPQVKLHIFSDAPKQERHTEAVQEVRGIIRAFAADPPPGLAVQLEERDTNLGLAGSIAGAVTSLVATHRRVVVLEDDLVPTPDFLPFMLDGLDRYREEARVMQISGCLLPGRLAAKTDGVLLPLTTTWGWATWDRAWAAFRPLGAPERGLLEKDPALYHRFTAEGRVDYVAMLDDRLAGRNDSWGILWWFAVARAEGLVLYPRESLIWNGGFDASGVHCGGAEEYSPSPPPQFREARIGVSPRFPQRIETDVSSWHVILDYFEKRSNPITESRNTKMRNFLKRFLSKL